MEGIYSLNLHGVALVPIGSMYAIYGNIYHQYTPNVSIYIPYMDPMGYVLLYVVVADIPFWA